MLIVLITGQYSYFTDVKYQINTKNNYAFKKILVQRFNSYAPLSGSCKMNIKFNQHFPLTGLLN